MSFTILIGIDGAEGGVDALALARRVAPEGADLVAVTVAVMDGHPSRAVNLDYDRGVREDAHLRLGEVRAEHRDVHGEVREARSVAVGLHAAAESLGADLIVVGSCRRGLVGRIFAGDDVRETLRGAPCPVAVAPREFALVDRPVVTIGLGWDGGAEADHALAYARGLAGDTGATVHVLSVVAVPEWPVSEGTTTDPEIASAVERVAGLLDALDDVESSTVTGDAVDELATFAAEVDVLVVGSHQRGPLGRIAMGSTSERLACRSTRPLIVVPRAPQPAVSPA